jgi:thiol-disulfide isomerase/thioredoxin
MRRYIFFTIIVILFSGCSNKKVFKIDGHIAKTDKKHIYLTRIDVDTPVLIDSAKIGLTGSFKFKVKVMEPDFYQIGFSNTDFITLLTEPGEKIKLSFKGKYLYENYEISGSAGTEKIKVLDIKLAETKRKIDSLKNVYENAFNKPDFISVEKKLDEEFVSLLKEQRTKNIEFILKNLNSFASIKALYQKIDENTYVLYDPHDVQFLKLVSDSLSLHYPASKQTQALKKNLQNELNSMFESKIDQLAKNIPETKLDPDLKDINGKRITLSSLRGKYVLLCFWSASSDDCISENIELKQLYTKYNQKGFEIYQINLDLNEGAWKKAVAYDELPWISVREDDPLNPLNARIFNIKSLPANYLYDKTGNIIASNIHGRNLHLELSQLFDN